jgi:glutamyl/glutaminyl-tRNA synthetase
MLHIGGVRTAVFNWLFARAQGGEFKLRIENTDTSREVAQAVDQIQESLRWLGLDWDGDHTFQLDRMEACREVAQRLVAEGKAYEDEGAIRFRMPDEGTTGWDDVVRGHIEFPNGQLEDLVLVRSDGRPTYNFASPMEDVWDEITHVIRGDDHVSNTPKQINLILVERFDLSRVQSSPAAFDFEKLDWMNGVYLRALPPDEYAHELLLYLGEQGYDWDAELVHRAAPLVQEKVEKLGDFPTFAGFLFGDVSLDGHQLDSAVLEEAERALREVEPFTAAAIEPALRQLAERLGLKPRDAFQPIRIAVTGSKVSPGLFESLELLGKERSLERLSAARS